MAFSTFTNTTMTMESCNVAAANSLSELAQTVKEKGLWIFGESDSKRRLITIEKKDGSYGFTLQSYGVRYKHGNRETDFITYVNAVEKDGAAFYAGLREGDVILSVNGQNMARTEHRSLVSFIRKCPSHLKMVVISDERARKVELHMRYVHLQKKLHDKMKELEQLNRTEREILSGTYKGPTSTSLGDMCFGDDISSCCFCPSKSNKGFLDDKEKSKSMGSTDKMKDKDSYHYDCYRKSQSTKDLANDPSVIASSSSLKLLCNNFSSSGGELAAVTTTTNAGASSGTGASSKSAQSSSSSRYHSSHNGSSQVGTPGCNVPSTSGTSSSGESQNAPKPKSWDNLMTTKSYGGYGFGFGYGYYPSKHGHHHFSHPHHHNHHTHCGSRGHNSSYYYNNNGGSQANPGCSSRSQAGSHPSRERRASTDASSSNIQQGPSSGDQGGGSRPFTNYTTYKMIGTTRVVARVTMGNIETAVGSCTRTLPSMRSSSSSRRSHTPDSSSFSSKMEKTLSDSSLNSEHHKDFPKSMSYFSRNSENDSRYSSDDEYDEYATEPNYGGKHDIYV